MTVKRRGAIAAGTEESATPKTVLSGDERLLLEVIDALRGADNLHERLLMALQTGTPAVADLAYAVKARVKEDYKVIDKIKDRRAGDEDRPARPDYNVSDVTDLVGLRIVTLYRLDVIEVIEALLTTIDRDRSASAPFVAGSISEIIIYSTNATGDVQGLPAKVMRLFEDYGLGKIARLAERPSNYSSIHILARGRGKYRDGYRELPIEIQVRTALEDVWGQIEHSLKYKREGIRNRPAPDNTRLATTLSHLGALKTMIDGIAQYGDQIKLQIDELEPDLKYSASKTAEETGWRLARLTDLPAEARSEIAAAVADAKPALTDQSQPPQLRTRVLRSAMSRLEAVEEMISGLTGLRKKTVLEVRYIIHMQRALFHFQLGNLVEDGQEQLAKAYELYCGLEAVFPARVIVKYRIARTLDALGSRDQAIARMREVITQLHLKSEPTPKDHWIRSTAPRSLGVMLWQEAKGSSGSEDGILDANALNLIREAYLLTVDAHHMEVFENPDAETGPPEKVRAANNLLYYLLDYLELGGVSEEGMGEAQVALYLSEIGGDRPSEITTLPAADTARRAHAHLGRRDLEIEAARTVVRLAPQAQASRSQIGREAVRAAERVINQGTDSDRDEETDPEGEPSA